MANEEASDDTGGGNSAPDVEARAKEMGWIPKEQFRGPEDKWVDAQSFVERGETILPIIQANNRKLYGKVAALESQLAQATTVIKSSQETIEALKEFNDEMAQRQAKTRKTELRTAINAAREAGDVEQENELMDELGEVSVALKKAEASPRGTARPNGQQPPREQPPVQPDPITQQWMTDNTWFGQDERRTDLAMVVAQRLRRDPANAGLQQRAFLDKVAEEVDEILPSGARRNGHDRVEGGVRSSGATHSGSGKHYSDLPKEAKEACDKQARRLVGEGRAFKDMASWQRHYCAQYFKD